MIILDTHIWVWWVQQDERLTQQHQILLQVNQPNGLGMSIYSCWEVSKLVEHNRLVLPWSLEEWFRIALTYPGGQLLNLTLPIISQNIYGSTNRRKKGKSISPI